MLKIFLYLISFTLSFQVYAQNVVPHEELNSYLEAIRATQNSRYPIGTVQSVHLAKYNKIYKSYVVLYRLPETHKFIKALAIRSNPQLNDDGSSRSYTPIEETSLKSKRDTPFHILGQNLGIKLTQNENGYLLETKICFSFKRDPETLQMPKNEKEKIMNFITQSIEENWKGDIDGIPFKTKITSGRHCIGVNILKVTLSKTQVRSYVSNFGTTGHWGIHFNDPYLYAHEFGHLIGFEDLYTDVAFYDLDGNLLSKTDIRTHSVFSDLDLLSPISHLRNFDSYIPEHNANIMASCTLGKVLAKHLESIVQKYAQPFIFSSQK